MIRKKNMLSVIEFAREVGITQSSVRQACQIDKLDCVKEYKGSSYKYLISEDQLDKYLSPDKLRKRQREKK